MCFRFGGLIGFAVGPGFSIKKDGLDTYRSWGSFSYRHCGRHCPCSVQKVIETKISTNVSIDSSSSRVIISLYNPSFSCSKSVLAFDLFVSKIYAQPRLRNLEKIVKNYPLNLLIIHRYIKYMLVI